jgi:hypothetical protein
MTNAIGVRAAEAKDTMTMVMVVCNAGIIRVSKANFIPNRVGNDEREAEGGEEGREGGGGCRNWLREEGSAGIIVLGGRQSSQLFGRLIACR